MTGRDRYTGLTWCGGSCGGRCDECRADLDPPEASIPSHTAPAELVVVELEFFADRYQACVRQGDAVWSFDCTHLHHSIDAARRCFDKLERRWLHWTDAEMTVVQVDPYPIVELGKPVTFGDGKVGRESTRYTPQRGNVIVDTARAIA